MEKHIIPIQFNGLGIEYRGWATPSTERHEDGYPKHYKVVLNKMFFGNFFLDRGKWLADGQQPVELVVAIGECLDRLPARHRAMV
jgi:hypothetical protein